MSPEAKIRSYETLAVFHPDAGESGVAELTEQVKATVLGNGGSVSQIEPWGMRELAYVIRKQTRGHYLLVCYDGTEQTLKELERSLKLSDRVLRVTSVRQARTANSGNAKTPRVAENSTETSAEAGKS